MTADERAIDHIHSIKTIFLEGRNQYKTEIIYYINGKRHSKLIYNTNERYIPGELKSFIADIFDEHLVLLSPDISFKDFALTWLEKVYSNHVQQQTKFHTRQIFINYIIPVIGHLKINEVKAEDIQKIITQLVNSGLSRDTIRQSIYYIKSCYKYYRIITETNYDPCEYVIVPKHASKTKRSIRFFNYQERKIIEKFAFILDDAGNYKYTYGPACVLMMHTGMRVCEATALTWQDIDLSNKTLDINKSKIQFFDYNKKSYWKVKYGSKTPCSLRVIPLSKKARLCLIDMKQHSNNSQYVISDTNGESVNRIDVYNGLNDLLKDAGIIQDEEKVGTHSLRHTFASMLFENGCNTKVISELLGHSSTKTTENTYVHIIQTQKAKAIKDLDKYCI